MATFTPRIQKNVAPDDIRTLLDATYGARDRWIVQHPARRKLMQIRAEFEQGNGDRDFRPRVNDVARRAYLESIALLQALQKKREETEPTLHYAQSMSATAFKVTIIDRGDHILYRLDAPRKEVNETSADPRVLWSEVQKDLRRFTETVQTNPETLTLVVVSDQTGPRFIADHGRIFAARNQSLKDVQGSIFRKGELDPKSLRGASYLDVGCGFLGLAGTELGQAGAMVNLLDIFPVDYVAVSALPSYQQGSILNAPYPNDQFDVISVSWLLNVPRDRLLAELLRLIKPGGRVTVSPVFDPEFISTIHATSNVEMVREPYAVVFDGKNPIGFTVTFRKMRK